MGVENLLSIHPLLADRVRLAIMASLAATSGEVDFVSLKERLDLTQGNLSSHIRKLEEAGLVEVHKLFEGRKPKTSFRCTEEGRDALQKYLSLVEEALRNSITRDSEQ